jgi:hypothetical protein
MMKPSRGRNARRHELAVTPLSVAFHRDATTLRATTSPRTNQGQIEVTYLGKRYRGEWRVKQNVLTLDAPGLGREMCQLDGSDAEQLARDLLLEVVSVGHM